MKQLLQNLRDGQAVVAEVPVPTVRPGAALVQTAASLVSAGTERTAVSFAEKSLLGKARSRPDLVRQVLDKARREGFLTSIEAAFNRLDQPMALGYASAGTIVAVGPGLEGFHVGDRVACAGSGQAVHAEYGLVPKNLLTPLPDNVDYESAAFTTLGAIALHGFRLAQPQLGERVAVIGLGLLGLLAVQIARSAGCHVFGMDVNPARVELARQFGIQAAVRTEADAAGQSFTRGAGFDVVLICADARSNDPVELAGHLARDRAQVVAIGAVGLSIPRKTYYEKEINFIVSRSYGPGRYDPGYELAGHDYPAGYVRWTEGRNFVAFLDLVSSGKVDLKPLISHRFAIQEAPQAYQLITGKLKQPFLGVLLTYAHPAQDLAAARTVAIHPAAQRTAAPGKPVLGVLGAGNYASAMFLPAVRATGGVVTRVIASASGLSASSAARRYGFELASSNEDEVLDAPGVDLVAILTRHNHHARQVIRALQNGKHVYCEKPLALNGEELEHIFRTLHSLEHPGLLDAGFNRRFAPFSLKLKPFFAGRGEPLYAHYRVNAGYLPSDFWLHDPQQGGGRIIGEGCHFIDYLTFLVGAAPVSVSAQALPDGGRYHQDNVQITLRYPDGSLGTVTYLANGDKSASKEYLEVFSNGRVAILDDFRRLELVQGGQRQVFRATLRQDKGHQAAWAAFLAAVQDPGRPAPIPYAHLWAVTQATFCAMTALQTNAPVAVPPLPEEF
jgi:predicted dehydrogenase/threonine dehydrogenase-like Zn-dependent dehydrogenase